MWGYGFENILKGIIIAENKIKNPNYDQVSLDKIKSHDLSKLFEDANIELDEKELFYINIIEKCAI
ncbi:MAG: hypothetical protein JXR70_14650 [Spirochaetales bacterium]|nr:hypothetical protein [Spirochaetales bacterium]